MTDKTVSSSKSSSKSSSSSLALEKQRPPKVLFTFLSLSLSLFPRVVDDDAKTKSTVTKAHKVSRFFSCFCRSRVRDERRGNKPKKRKNTESSREIREIFANGHMCRRDANEKRQHVSRKKAKQKNFSRFFSLSLSRVLSRPLLRLGEDTNLI